MLTKNILQWKTAPKIYTSVKISFQNIIQWNMPSKYTSVKHAPKQTSLKKSYHKNILQWKIPSKILLKNAKKLLEWKIPKNTCWLETTEHSPDCTSRIKTQSSYPLQQRPFIYLKILFWRVMFSMTMETRFLTNKETLIQLLLMWMTSMYSF